MKYLATADSLVDDSLVTWDIEADNLETAFGKAYRLAQKSLYADEGSLLVRPIEEEEDKQAICDKLLEALKLCGNCYGLIYLKYLEKTETVVAHFPSGEKRINVAMDSGTSMIKDIIRGII